MAVFLTVVLSCAALRAIPVALNTRFLGLAFGLGLGFAFGLGFALIFGFAFDAVLVGAFFVVAFFVVAFFVVVVVAFGMRFAVVLPVWALGLPTGRLAASANVLHCCTNAEALVVSFADALEVASWLRDWETRKMEFVETSRVKS